MKRRKRAAEGFFLTLKVSFVLDKPIILKIIEISYNLKRL